MSQAGMTKTIIWTQFHAAVKADFGIILPNKVGVELTEVITGISELLTDLTKENRKLKLGSH